MRRWLTGQAWPGNVRELKHALESMTALDFDGVLGTDDLPPDEAVPALSSADGIISGPDPMLGRPLADVERYYMERALEMTANNREEAAKMLGIGERTLYRKLQEWKKTAD